MEDVNQASDLIDVESSPSEHLWRIALNADLLLIAEPAPARSLLVLSAELGKPADGDSAFFNELFLLYAHAWDASGGLRMSLDPAAGSAWLLLDVAPNNMSVTGLVEVFMSFAERVRVWRQIVTSPRDFLDDLERIETLVHSSMMRV
ncbi:MAG: type III secretion system chaperone [Ramlibacter sp.]